MALAVGEKSLWANMGRLPALTPKGMEEAAVKEALGAQRDFFAVVSFAHLSGDPRLRLPIKLYLRSKGNDIQRLPELQKHVATCTQQNKLPGTVGLSSRSRSYKACDFAKYVDEGAPGTDLLRTRHGVALYDS